MRKYNTVTIYEDKESFDLMTEFYDEVFDMKADFIPCIYMGYYGHINPYKMSKPAIFVMNMLNSLQYMLKGKFVRVEIIK